MSYLMDIGEDVQKFAEVIQNVLNVDVTIVDNEFKRVAGSGKYKELLGCSISGDSVFARVLKTGQSYFVDSPRECNLCSTCSSRNNCVEYAETCCPIMFNGKAIGVIGLVAFEENQKQALITNKDSLLQFLNQMADLISSKVHEMDILARNKVLRKQLETIIDTIDEGIIAINQEGVITHCNFAARKILKLDIIDVIGQNINFVFPEFIKKLNFQNDGDISNNEFTIKNGSYIRVLLSTKSIIFNNSRIGRVLIVRTISEIRKVINHVSGSNVNIYFEDIIGTSDVLNDVKDKAIKASTGNSTVFITGESGTGKEMFARAIHSCSVRRDKPFIAINCAAIPETLLESELFGYEEGAFTGAKKGGRIGKFELANGGTVFLDEIGDMPLHLQTKLLRVLQERIIERVGGQYGIPIDVWVITATHKDIFKMLNDGEFRYDLFYRLNVIPIIIPPLRDRKEDIPLLMKYMLKKCCEKLNKCIEDFTRDVYDIFMNYDWNGNIRELENAVEYTVNMESGCLIGMNSLPPRFKNVELKTKYNDIVPVKNLERDAIFNALNIFGFSNKNEAAKALGMSRATFYRKIKEYGIVSK